MPRPSTIVCVVPCLEAQVACQGPVSHMRDTGKVRYLPRRRIVYPRVEQQTDAGSNKLHATHAYCTLVGVHIEAHVEPSHDCSTLARCFTWCICHDSHEWIAISVAISDHQNRCEKLVMETRAAPMDSLAC